VKPNGRRRWRKRAKSLRYGLKHGWPEVLEWSTPKVRADLLRPRKHHSSLPLPPPATHPFDPRSLVGMSEARKRSLFGREVDALPTDQRSANLVRLYHKYRIGERLRPCPGCCACKSKPAIKRALKRAGHSVYASLLKHGQAWICGKLIITIATNSINQIHTGRNHCDGSGILPAKRQP